MPIKDLKKISKH